MKVVVFKNDIAGRLFGEKYNNQFFQDLWKTNLEDKEEIDEVVYHDFVFNTADLAEVVKDADAAVGMWMLDGMINKDLVETLAPKTKYYATAAHGYGSFDLEATKRAGVTLTNTVYGDVTIAQYAMGMLLDICHNVTRHSDYLRTERWEEGSTPRHVIYPQIELYEKTIGIIGLGSIGLKLAEMAHGFGMNVISYTRTKKEGPAYDFIEQVSLDELLERSDFISIHCPHTAQTTKLINKDTIAKMKDGVILINTARGEIIDEDDLYDALKSKKIAFAGLDVVCQEPLQAPCKLMELDNVKITGHIAWLTVESHIRSIKMMSQQLLDWIHGNPTSVINK